MIVTFYRIFVVIIVFIFIFFTTITVIIIVIILLRDKYTALVSQFMHINHLHDYRRKIWKEGGEEGGGEGEGKGERGQMKKGDGRGREGE